LSVILSACSTSKKARRTTNSGVNEITDENTIESVIVNNLSTEDFYIQKADINVSQNNFSARLNASIKFRKPDSLLITVRSRAGIEAGRALITKDTILINDKINNKLLIGSPSVIGPKYGIEPSLIFLVIGDVIVNDYDKNATIKCQKGFYKNEYEVKGKKVEYIIDCERKKATRAYFEGDIRSGNITIKYSDIVQQEQIRYPQKIEINDDLNSLNIVLEIKKIERPWKGRITFIPGHGFKVIRLK
jgi:hypothetical protein